MPALREERPDLPPLLFAGEWVDERNLEPHAAKGVAPMETAEHWEKVYATKRSDQVSWYQPHLDLSLRMIADVGQHRDVAIIDVGGGESTNELDEQSERSPHLRSPGTRPIVTSDRPA